VSEQSDFGPDLTHLGSRNKIGAGILPMTADELRGWIANAQTVKPGAQMPPQDLTDDQLDALVAYLVSLE
jgi:cytochrome c oxidase subunit 2